MTCVTQHIDFHILTCLYTILIFIISFMNIHILYVVLLPDAYIIKCLLTSDFDLKTKCFNITQSYMNCKVDVIDIDYIFADVFAIKNFPFLSSNIPSSPAYGVFISQLIRYVRACSSYECSIRRAVRLSNKLLWQGYVKEHLKSSLRKFYGRYGDHIKQYKVPLSQMLHDILDDDHLQWHPPLIRHYTNFWPYYWSRPSYRIWLFT